jgi:uncharacterized protein YcfL
MKKSTRTLAIVGMLTTQICLGCNSNKEKTETATSNLINASADLAKVKAQAVADSTKQANNAEWQIFKTETEAKIKVQEIRIGELKKNLKANRSEKEKDLIIRIEALEEKNETLKKRLATYGKVQGDWQRFKTEFGQDMDQLGQALKSFTVPRKR